MEVVNLKRPADELNNLIIRQIDIHLREKATEH